MANKIERMYDRVPLVTREEAQAFGLTQYFTGKPCRKGHIAPRTAKWGACLVCSSEKMIEHRQNARAKDPEGFQAKRRKQRLNNAAMYLFMGARSRAKKRGYEFNISVEDVAVSKNCPCCSQEMGVREGEAKNGPSGNSYSLDRIDSSKGYVKGNVAVICWRCNETKRNATIQELETVLHWMKSFEKPKLALVS